MAKSQEKSSEATGQEEDSGSVRTRSFGTFREFRDAILINDDVVGDFPVYGGPLKTDNHIYRGLSTDKHELIPSAFREPKSALQKFHEKVLEPLRKKAGLQEDENVVSRRKFDNTDGMQIQKEYKYLHWFYKTANNHGLKVSSSEFVNNNYFDDPSSFDIGKIRTAFKKWYPAEFAELAALAQHYGTPTRLLDWTQDIYVALYFAAIGAVNRILEEIKDYDTNLGNLQDKILFKKVMDIPIEENIVIWKLDGGRLQFGKYFVTKEEREHYSPLKIVVPPYSDNPNLAAQKGVLTYWETDVPGYNLNELDRRPLNQLVDEYNKTSIDGWGIDLVKYTIPITECAMIYRYLRRLGYTAARLFPGYAGVAKQIEDDKKFEELHTYWIMADYNRNKTAKEAALE